ncbi:hypothetical protein GV054_08300 [Marinomonas mediterranea]|uniref:hypothetical protein n=1 Tax=Marinomonas mediterranea TaxID=119864 RepID=UPI0002E7F9F9|nr:hypothetical protein [Marinomonas mediterranea]WCN13004.1 hypothetical protein GV054_08300 [Marinomonas mediterranea]WCN17077.1 hypothetical protein GV053_08480 [Marinomonas mediterranea MMB-1]
MQFDRITENQAYENVVKATKKLWEQGIGSPIFEDHLEFKKLNLKYKRCTTGGFGVCGEGEYSGLIVTDGDNGYRVISIFVDALCPEDTEFKDVTESLGKNDPTHNQCDIRNTITMAILYYLELFDELPQKYKKYC